MNSYLVISGIVFNIIIFLAIVYIVVDTIRFSIIDKRESKRQKEENIRKQELFEEELVEAKQLWVVYAEILKALQENLRMETNKVDILYKGILVSGHMYSNENRFYFKSTSEWHYLSTLGEEQGWSLKSDNPN